MNKMNFNSKKETADKKERQGAEGEAQGPRLSVLRYGMLSCL